MAGGHHAHTRHVSWYLAMAIVHEQVVAGQPQWESSATSAANEVALDSHPSPMGSFAAEVAPIPPTGGNRDSAHGRQRACMLCMSACLLGAPCFAHARASLARRRLPCQGAPLPDAKRRAGGVGSETMTHVDNLVRALDSKVGRAQWPCVCVCVPMPTQVSRGP